jgi:L-rhamnono-1,4-lactonase
MAKPDLTIYNPADRAFTNWRNAIYALSKCDNTYVKLSGGFSEMPESLRRQTPSEIFQALFPWFGVVLATFGASKIMFASDWPVCKLGHETLEALSKGKEEEKSEGKQEKKNEDGEEEAWAKWKAVVDKTCWMATMEEGDMKMLYGGTAAKAYGI